MSYDKGSFDTFKASLKNGKYETATGARRAIGKLAQLSAEEKDKARKMVDVHFGESSSTSKSPKSEKKVAAPKAAPKAAAAPARQPRTAAAAAPVTERRKPGRPARTVTTESFAPHIGAAPLDDLTVGERVVIAATQALTSLERVKDAFTVDTSKAVAEYTQTLSRTVGLFRRVVTERLGAEAAPVKQLRVEEEEEPADELPNGRTAGQPYFPDLEAQA